MDVCRARDIPCYGYDKQTMPIFCQYAKQNIFFEKAYANSAWTLPGHASIFTGLYASHHKIIIPYTDKLAPNIPLLSDVLHTNGYETYFFMPEDQRILPLDVYKRGMTQFISNGYAKEGYLDSALNILRHNSQTGKKTFLSFYDFTCHGPYFQDGPLMFTDDSFPDLPSKEDDVFSRFTEGFYYYLLAQLPKAIEINDFGDDSDKMRRVYEKLSSVGYKTAKETFSEILQSENVSKDHFWTLSYDYFYASKLDIHNKRQMEYLRSLYNQRLYDVDTSIIRKIRDAMAQSPLKDNTVVVIASEHGEEFGEHGIVGHATLYNSNLQIPFMMSVPNFGPVTIPESVQLVDIMPTLLDIVGIQNNYSFDGISLVPRLTGKAMPERLLVAEGSHWESDLGRRAVLDKQWKLFIKLKDNKILPYELYNIADDPEEKHNLLMQNWETSQDIIGKYSKLTQ